MTENELLDELARELVLPDIDTDNEVTARQLAPRLNLSEGKTLSRLKDKVAAGEMSCRWVKLPSGYKALAFRKVAVS